MITETTPISSLSVAELGAVINTAVERSMRQQVQQFIKPSEYLSDEEALQLINRTHRTTLTRLASQGLIVSSKPKKGAPRMWTRKSIEKYLQSLIKTY